MTAAFFRTLSTSFSSADILLDIPLRYAINPCASMKIPTPDAKIASIYRTKLIHADAFVCVMCFFIFDFCTLPVHHWRRCPLGICALVNVLRSARLRAIDVRVHPKRTEKKIRKPPS